MNLSAVDAKGFRVMAAKTVIAQPAVAQGGILSPGNGDVIPPGATVPLIAARRQDANRGMLQAWSVVQYSGSVQTELPVSHGILDTFVMPALGEDGRVEVRHKISSAGGRAATQDQIVIHAAAEDGYVRNWWLISGGEERGLDFDALPGGERNFALPDPRVKAAFIRSPSRKIDLAGKLSPNLHTMGYAFVWIEAPTDRDALLGLLSDDGIAVWVNGRQIWQHPISRLVSDDLRDIDLPPIKLRKGLNSLLIKVEQNDGEWALKARVLMPDGSIMRDITLRAAP